MWALPSAGLFRAPLRCGPSSVGAKPLPSKRGMSEPEFFELAEFFE